MKYKKRIIEELQSLPSGYIVKHYPGGELYRETYSLWENKIN